MNTFIIVGMIAYASIVRPIMDDPRVDTHNMWVWQLVTIAIVVMPSWIPFWSEITLLLCFVIGCMAPGVLSHNVSSLVFPAIRRRLTFLKERIDGTTDGNAAPTDAGNEAPE